MDRLPRMVTSPAELGAMVTALRDAPLIAVDTESNAFHAYRPRVCLIQVADRDHEWAVDPLAINDLSPLASLLQGASPTKVIHAADGDILALRRDLHFGIAPVFDTMLAARIIGLRRFGLADLLEQFFQVKLDKRYQRYDWAERPMSEAALRYAASDVRHLLDLHDLLRRQLVEAGRLDEAEEEFARITRVLPEERPFDPDTFWRVRGARDLPPPARAPLRELYVFRDSRARALDRAPVRVMGDDVLIALSQQRPVDAPGLRRAGLSALQIERHGAAVLAAIADAAGAPPPEPPRGNGPPPDPRITARYDGLRVWRRERAAARGVEPEIIISNAALRALARATPRDAADVGRVAQLGPWKTAEYGEDLCRALARLPEMHTEPDSGG